MAKVMPDTTQLFERVLLWNLVLANIPVWQQVQAGVFQNLLPAPECTYARGTFAFHCDSVEFMSRESSAISLRRPSQFDYHVFPCDLSILRRSSSRFLIVKPPISRHRTILKELPATKDGEHEDVIAPHAVYDAVAAQKHFADIIALDLGNHPAGKRHPGRALGGFSQFADPVTGRARIVPHDVEGDLLEISKGACGPPN